MLIWVTCIVVISIALLPLYWMFLVSIRTRLELFSSTPKLYPTSFFFLNYYKPFFQDVFGRYLINSLIIASANTGLALVCAIFAAYAFSRYKTGGSGLFFWILTNRMAPPAAFLLPVFLIFSNLKLIDTYIGLILLYCIFNVPFAIWLLRGPIDAIPTELDDAASVDGCSTLGIIWHIIIPAAKSGIVITALMTWLFSWNEYLFASILTSIKARTITTGLAEFVTVVGTNWGEMAAVAIVCLVPAIILFGFVQKHIVAGLTFGAIK